MLYPYIITPFAVVNNLQTNILSTKYFVCWAASFLISDSGSWIKRCAGIRMEAQCTQSRPDRRYSLRPLSDSEVQMFCLASVSLSTTNLCQAGSLLFCRAPLLYSSVRLTNHRTVQRWLEAAGLHITTSDRTGSNVTRLVVRGWNPLIIHSHSEVWQQSSWWNGREWAEKDLHRRHPSGSPQGPASGSGL